MNNAADIRIEPIAGDAVHAFLGDLARLRMTVFREWPYLYDGDAASEEAYLAGFSRGKGAIIVAAFDGTEVLVFDPETWAIRSRIAQSVVEELTFLGDGHLATRGVDEVVVWDVDEGVRVGSTIATDADVDRWSEVAPSVAAAPDADLVALVAADDPDVVEVWAATPRAWIDVACEFTGGDEDVCR